MIKVFARKTVVDETLDPRLEISLDAAREINPNYQLDDIVEIEVTPADFGRIAAQTAKQVVTQRIREAERGLIYEAFIDKEEDIVTGIVQRQDTRNIYVDLGKVEAVLPLDEVMPGEKFRQSDRIKAYITRVENTTKGPQILLSRTHPGLLKRLFELEVPEIYDGIVEIKSVAREADSVPKLLYIPAMRKSIRSAPASVRKACGYRRRRRTARGEDRYCRAGRKTSKICRPTH